MNRRVRSILKSVGLSAIALSLLLCVTSVGMWARSYWSPEKLERISAVTGKPMSKQLISSVRGILLVSEIAFDDPSPFPDGVRWKYSPEQPSASAPGVSLLKQLGFGYFGGVDPPPSMRLNVHVRWISAPHWFLAAFFAASPLTWFICRRQRIPAGHCQTCGYDQRATPERCPECGTPAETH
jgi:hypothetical protein